jgi:hypothetical protein
LSIDPVDPNDIHSKFLLTHAGSEKPIECTFQPFYLYESVTKNITEIDDHHNE